MKDNLDVVCATWFRHHQRHWDNVSLYDTVIPTQPFLSIHQIQIHTNSPSGSAEFGLLNVPPTPLQAVYMSIFLPVEWNNIGLMTTLKSWYQSNKLLYILHLFGGHYWFATTDFSSLFDIIFVDGLLLHKVTYWCVTNQAENARKKKKLSTGPADADEAFQLFAGMSL